MSTESFKPYNKQEAYFGDLKLDGQIGPKTLQSMKEYIDMRGLSGRKVLADTYRCLRGYHYINLAEKDPSQESFVWGWMKNRL